MAAVLATASITAQEAMLTRGVRIRITTTRSSGEPATRHHVMIGRFEALDDRTLSVTAADGSAQTVPRRSIYRLEVSDGRHSPARNGVIGAVLGAIGGGAVASMSARDCPQQGGSGFAPCFGAAFGAGALLFGGVGRRNGRDAAAD